MADIRIDRYEFDVTTDGSTQTITDVGNTDYAFIRVTGCTHKGSAGQNGFTSNMDPNDFCMGVVLTGTNEVTFHKQLSNSLKIMFEVWVYTGSPGGAYEFINRGRGGLTINNGTNNNSAGLSGVVNKDDVIPFYNGFSTTENSRSDMESCVLAFHVNGSGDVVASRVNNGTGDAITGYYDAPEFTGSAWNVGHGVSNAHDIGNNFTTNAGETVTLNRDSTGAGGASYDVTDWATAMIIEASMEGDTAETGLSDTMAYVKPSGTTEVIFMLDNANSRNDGAGYVHVLQADDLIVSRTFLNSFTEGNNTYGTLAVPAGVNAATPLSELSLEWFPGTNGEGTAHARGSIHAQITAATGNGLQHWIHRQGNTCKCAYAFADVSGLTDAGGGVTLTVNESVHSLVSDSPDVSHSYNLTTSQTDHGVISDAPSLSHSYSLSLNDTEHSHLAETVSLGSSVSLSVNATTHTHTSEQAGLTHSYNLSTDNAVHGLISDSVSLSFGASLSVNSAAHSHAAEQASLSHAYLVAPLDAQHGLISEKAILSTSINLVVSYGVHSVISDNVSLSGEYDLTVNDASHSIESEQVLLSPGFDLSVNNTEHLHGSEQPVISHAYLLSINDCVHGHTSSDFLSVSQSSFLVPSSNYHNHTAQSVVIPLEDVILELSIQKETALGTEISKEISLDSTIIKDISI